MQADNLRLTDAERRTLEGIASSEPAQLMSDAIARVYEAMGGNHPCAPWSITRELSQDLAAMNDGMSQLVQDYFSELCGGDYGPDWNINRDEWTYELTMSVEMTLPPDEYGNTKAYGSIYLTQYNWSEDEDWALELAKDTVEACKKFLARLDGDNKKQHA